MNTEIEDLAYLGTVCPTQIARQKKEESVQEAQLTILARSINKVKPVLNLKKGFSCPPEKDNYSPARQAR